MNYSLFRKLSYIVCLLNQPMLRVFIVFIQRHIKNIGSPPPPPKKINKYHMYICIFKVDFIVMFMIFFKNYILIYWVCSDDVISCVFILLDILLTFHLKSVNVESSSVLHACILYFNCVLEIFIYTYISFIRIF